MLGAIKKAWEGSKAWDEQSAYQARPKGEVRISALQKILAHTVYNPKTDFEIGWERTGDTDLAEVVAEIEDGLRHDDDIIQQWFGADDVLKLINSAKTFAELADRIECVCGGFEADERLRKIVVDVLESKRA